MSNKEIQNAITDRIDDVVENVSPSITNLIIAETSVTVIHDDPIDQVLPITQREKVNYEVVFFARYKHNPRPSNEDIIKFFNNYGVVHHVNCPDRRNYAFVFMNSLSTPVEHRRTRTTISQIIQDMNPENRFHISVANSNRGNQFNDQRQYRNYARTQWTYVPENKFNTYDNNNRQRNIRYSNKHPYIRNNDNNEQQIYPTKNIYRTNDTSLRNITQKYDVEYHPNAQKSHRETRSIQKPYDQQNIQKPRDQQNIQRTQRPHRN